MRAKESREMYLEVIYRLEQKNGKVLSIDIAKELGYSKPSVSRAMGVLTEAGYITHTPYGDVTLTEEGREKAKKVYLSHRILTDFFTQTLGINADVAEADACKIEHVISEQTLNAIKSYMQENK